MQKGFVTVATGDEKYYKLAADLLLSYKKRGKGNYPFCIICDRENQYTKAFDDVVITKEFRKSTVDKLLIRFSPYDESIFLDSDTLVLNNIDDLWDVFADQDDFSVFGVVLPKESKDGWFTYEGSGKYKDRINYMISMNGGIYYLRNTDRAKKILNDALIVIDDYSDIDFKYFTTPQDEPLIAMSMVINNCIPCDKKYNMIILPVSPKKVTVKIDGTVYEGRTKSNASLIHFSEPRTKLFMYNYLNSINHTGNINNLWIEYFKLRIRYLYVDFKFSLFHQVGHLLRKIGMAKLVERLREILE